MNPIEIIIKPETYDDEYCNDDVNEFNDTNSCEYSINMIDFEEPTVSEVSNVSNHPQKNGDLILKTEPLNSNFSSESSELDKEHINLKLNINVGTFSCKLLNCAKIFTMEEALMKHQTSESHQENTATDNAKSFTCQECFKCFTRRFGLKRHQELHKKPEDWSYQCTICEKKCSNQRRLRRHMVIHSKRTPWKCEHCHKKFKLKESLVKHSEYHKKKEDWKYQCSTCGKKCVNKKNLTDHLLVHSDENPWICEQCGKRFKRKRTLKKHVKLH